MTISKIVYMVDHYIEDPFVKGWIKRNDIAYSSMTCLNFTLQVHGLGRERRRSDCGFAAVVVYKYCTVGTLPRVRLLSEG